MYQQIKDELTSVRQALVKKNSELTKVKKELDAIGGERENLHQIYKNRCISDAASSREKHLQERLAPLEEKLSEAEIHLTSVQQEYDEVKHGLTFDNLYAQYSSKQEILQEAKESVETLHGVIGKILGNNFLNRLTAQLETKNIDLASADLTKLIRYFNKCSERVVKFGEKPNLILGQVTTFERNLSEVDVEDKQGNGLVALITVVAVVATFFAYKYVFPFYVLFLAVLAAYYLYCSYNIFKILLVQKAVQDNIDKIDELLRQQVQQELDREIAEADKKFGDEINRTNELIQSLRNQISATTIQEDREYKFDTSGIEAEEKIAIEKLGRKESDLLMQRQTLQQECSTLTQRANQLQQELQTSVGDIQATYLDFNKVSTEPIFEPTFLFDIEQSKPVYFTHPETSCLFLYHDYQDVTDFIRLICMQLRAKLNPFNLSILVIDTVNIGSEFVYFIPNDSSSKENLSGLFSILSDEKLLQDKFIELNEHLQRKQKNIKREFSSIAEYNKKMVSLDSLTEDYEFVFVLDPKESVLENTNFLRVLKNGGILGIYSHLFISIEKFSEMGDNARSLLEYVDKVYLLQNGCYNERAKDFIIDNCLRD